MRGRGACLISAHTPSACQQPPSAVVLACLLAAAAAAPAAAPSDPLRTPFVPRRALRGAKDSKFFGVGIGIAAGVAAASTPFYPWAYPSAPLYAYSPYGGAYSPYGYGASYVNPYSYGGYGGYNGWGGGWGGGWGRRGYWGWRKA